MPAFSSSSRVCFRAAARAVFAALVLAALPATLHAALLQPEYPLSKLDDLMTTLSASPYVLPTATAGTFDYGNDSQPDTGRQKLVVAKTAGYQSGTKPAIPSQDVYGFHITDTTSTWPKKKVVLTAGTHPLEGGGSLQLDWLVRELVRTDSPAMDALRKKADIYVYPEINPEGRYGYHMANNPYGIGRGDPVLPDDDYGVAWGKNATNRPQILQIKPIMKADTSSDVDYFLDFHTRNVDNTPNAEIAMVEAMRNTPFVTNVLKIDSSISLWCPWTLDSVANWAHSAAGLNADFYYGKMETAHDLPLDDYKISTVYAYALNDTIPTPLPEPSTWAMLLAGLGALGLVWRRRKPAPRR